MFKNLSTSKSGFLLAASSAILYGFLGYFGVVIMQHGSSVNNMLFWRFFLSACVIFFISIGKISHLSKNFSEVLKLFFLGVLFFGPSSTCYFTAVRYITTGIAMVIFFIYPVFVIAINAFIGKKRISNKQLTAVAVIITGMILLIDLDKLKFDLMGTYLSLVSAFLYACYIVISNKIKDISPILSGMVVSLGASFTCLIVALYSDNFMVPKLYSTWIYMVSMAIICTSVPMIMLLKSMEYIGSEKASIISILEPVFVVIFGVILLDEPIHFKEIIGVIIMLFGAFIALKEKN